MDENYIRHLLTVDGFSPQLCHNWDAIPTGFHLSAQSAHRGAQSLAKNCLGAHFQALN